MQNFKLKREEIHHWGSISSSSLREAKYEYDQWTDLDPIIPDKGLSQEKIELKKPGQFRIPFWKIEGVQSQYAGGE